MSLQGPRELGTQERRPFGERGREWNDAVATSPRVLGDTRTQRR